MIYKIFQAVDIFVQRIFNLGARFRFQAGSKIYIHRSARILGAEKISIGRNFTALVGLRLEAVIDYKSVPYSPRIIIKDNVTLNDHVHIGASNYVEIGNNVLVASKVFISDHIHGAYSGPTQSSPEVPPAERPLTRGMTVVIEDNVWICEGVSILPGVRIGYGSIIGAHSVVTKNIPPFSIAVGIPAKVVKKYNQLTKNWEVANG